MSRVDGQELHLWSVVRWAVAGLSALTCVLALAVTTPAAGPFTSNGTQPPIGSQMRNSSQCQNCHGDYDSANHYEPWPTWVGSMMGQAGRDPLFWASLDVAENDFPGIGDFCLRCHAPVAWLEGRSEQPGGSTDGCGLLGDIDTFDADYDGLTCHFCHRMMVNPSPPGGQPTYYEENGQFWIADGACPNGGGQPCRLGPYLYPQDGTDTPPHPWDHSPYHEESRFCGNCHNVTNPALNLIIAGVDTGIPMPVERTYKEWQQSDFADLSSPSYQTCQNCHMPDPALSPAYACDSMNNDHTGDLPVHDFAGGNSWIPDVIRGEYPNLGIDNELIATRNKALDMLQNQSADVVVTAPASVSAGSNMTVTVRVTNLTGHKLPTGYPEGRRMWLYVQATDGSSTVFFESAAYDTANGFLTEDAQAKIYETKPGRWNHNGTNQCDVVDGASNPMFHFVLNDCVYKDNRIPPQGFTGGSDVETQPIGYTYPETSVGSGILVNYDETDYTIPVPAGTPGPISVVATLKYQTTSKDYVEFLDAQATTFGFPNDCIDRTTGTPTQSRAAYMLALWQAYGRSAPVDMDSDSGSVSVIGGPVCGNSIVEAGETCDPPANCPTACDDSNSCTTDTLTGSAANCDAACNYAPISACTGGDGCCPAGCDATTDTDCSANCGNSVVEPGETCDPPASCPTACDDGNSCTADTLTGSAANCNAACSFAPISACANADGCCPVGCDATVDDDCSASCGNSVVEPGETCDPPGSCPTACDDGNSCTADTLTGSAANCNVACSFAPLSACADSDGCCPAGCDASVDNDCSASCGNSVVEPGETCDPPGTCPIACDDGNSCTTDTLTGSAANCNAACSFAPVSECHDGDSCCPAGCDASVDSDCSASCGDGVVDAGETCDPPSSCPTTCDDGDGCTTDTLTGSAANCNADCSNAPISECHDGDGCCAPGCDDTVDADCADACGNGVVDPGETCDPPGSCPTTCDDGDACTVEALVGGAATCDATCTTAPVTLCADDDGCCPDGCDSSTDNDCTNPPSAKKGGCGCQSASSDSAPAVLLLLLFGLWIRRRRR